MNNINSFGHWKQKKYSKLFEEAEQKKQEMKPLNLFGAVSLLNVKPDKMMKVLLNITGADLKNKFEHTASLGLINILINAIGKQQNSGINNLINTLETSIKGDTLNVNIKGSNGEFVTFNINKDAISKMADSECILDMKISPTEASPESVNLELKLGNFLLYTPDGSLSDDNVSTYDQALNWSVKNSSGKSFSDSANNNAVINDLNSAFKSNIKDNKYLSVLKNITKLEDRDGYLKGDVKVSFVDSLSKGSELLTIMDIKKSEDAPKEATNTITTE